MDNKHTFALYQPLIQFKSESIVELQDQTLVHRISSVLRLAVGEMITLFDSQFHIDATIVAYKGKKLSLHLGTIKKNKPLHPSIVCLLPLLKRSAFDEALYSLAQLGVQTIQPIITSKSSRDWGSQKDFERANNIFIAAAEQSKQFILPAIKKPVALADAILQDGERIFFDAIGIHAWTILSAFHERKISALVICFGPEGDLTEQEKLLLRQNEYQFCALTESILKAEQAIALATGMMRSCLRK